jgi:hypothetical protein
MKALVDNPGPERVSPVPKSCFRRAIFNLVTSAPFDAFIMVVIIANVALMSCDFWGMEQTAFEHEYNSAMDYFAYIFYAEAVLKISGLGPAGYWADRWSRFDFFLVCTSLFDQIASEVLAGVLPIPPMLLRTLRVLRIVRILRLLRSFKELRSLLVTMIYSFPSLLNVSCLLTLVVFMYAVLGVDLFCFVAHQDLIDAGRNFETLGNAALLLFQCLTGDAWSGLMVEAMVSEELGLCTEAAGDCGIWLAIPYFISFQMIGSFVLLNLVVAVILENFTNVNGANPDLVTALDLDRFREAWGRFDPDADFYIRVEELPQLVLAVTPPMGLAGREEALGGTKAVLLAARKLCAKLDLQQYNGHLGEVAYIDVPNLLNYK